MLFTKGQYEGKWHHSIFLFIYIVVVQQVLKFLSHFVWKSLDKFCLIDKPFHLLAVSVALEVLRAMRSHGVPFNKDTLTLAFGTCYKLVMFAMIKIICYNLRMSMYVLFWTFMLFVLCGCFLLLVQNNKESYKICSSLIEEVHTKGHFMPRHAYCFAVALALRQVSKKSLFSILNHLESVWFFFIRTISSFSFLFPERQWKCTGIVFTNNEHWQPNLPKFESKCTLVNVKSQSFVQPKIFLTNSF